MASGQTVITVNLEVSGAVPIFDIDVTVTVDANGTITVDNTGPNIIDPVNIPDAAVPDGMTPVEVNLGTVPEADAAVAVGVAIAGALLRAYGELIGDLVEDFLDWFNGLVNNAWAWLQNLFENATAGPNETATEIVVAGGLDPEFGAQVIAVIAAEFQAWLDSQG